MKIQRYNKAIAGGLIPAVLIILARVMANYGIQMDAELQQAVGVLLTMAGVWAIPNRG